MKKRILANLNILRDVRLRSIEFAELKLKRYNNEDLVSNTNIAKEFAEYTNQLSTSKELLTELDECINWLNKQKS